MIQDKEINQTLFDATIFTVLVGIIPIGIGWGEVYWVLGIEETHNRLKNNGKSGDKPVKYIKIKHAFGIGGGLVLG